MALSSVASVFSFESYKVDYISFEMKKYLDLLEYTGNFDPKAFDLSINIGKPMYLSSDKKYISTLEIKLALRPNQEETSTEPPETMLNCELHIAGVFSVQEGRLEENTEKNLIRFQLPAILMPYARGVLTTILSNAGFGTVILPLINVNELAKQVESDLDIQVVE